MGTYTSRHLFAKMLLLSISSFGVESSWTPDVVCTFAPPKAWNVRPGTGNSSLLSPVAISFVGNEDTLNEWNSEAIIKKVRGMISMAMGLPSSAYWPVRSFVALFIRTHETFDEHCKNQSCDCWAYHNMLGTSNQLSLSARSPQCKTLSIYLYNEHLCRLSWCKKYWTYLHVSICVWHKVFFLGTHLQSPASPSIFAGLLLWFEHISISGQRCLWSAFYDMIKDVPPDAFFVHMTWYGSNLGLHKVTKLDGLRWFNLVLKPYSQLWLHGVSLYFNLESGLSLASGWNLCCASISFIASHLSFPFVVDLLCLIGQLHIMAIFQWDDVVGKDRDMTSRPKP